MPQPYDIQFPDLLGQYQRGWDMAEHRKRAPIESAQRDTVFDNTQNDRRDDEIGVVAGLIAAEPTPEGRARIYAQAAPKIRPLVQRYGVTMPEAWDESLLPEVQQLQQVFASRRRNGNEIPAGVLEFNALTNGLSDEDRAKAQRVKLGLDSRASSGLPYGFMEVTGADGVTRIIQTDKREGGAAEIGPGGAPQGVGAGPRGEAPNIMDFAMQASQVLGGRITSGYRTQAEQAALRAQGKTTTVNSQHNTSTGVDMTFPNPQAKAQAIAYAKASGINVLDEGNHVHFGIPRGVAPAGANPYASRPAEVQAGLNAGAAEGAKIDAQVGRVDAVAQSEAQIAAAKAKAEADAKATSEREANIAKRTQNAGTALDLLGEAESILPGATGSGAGALRDSGAAFFGQSTKGAQGAARLKTISGQLILMQPRMEGPQSDADRKLYAQMAGDLGNETLPNATRMAALKGMQKLQQKYAGRGQAAAAPAVGPKRLKFNPATGKIE